MIEQKRIGFIGGGQMGEAIFSGVLASGLVKPEQVSVTDVSAERLDTLGKKYGVFTAVNDGANSHRQCAKEAQGADFSRKRPK